MLDRGAQAIGSERDTIPMMVDYPKSGSCRCLRSLSSVQQEGSARES
jgi:hypothetical protein